MPVDPRPISLTPPVGWWVWLISEKIRHTSFHEVIAVEALRLEDETITVVEVACRRAWPLEHLAAAVPPHHPVLALELDGTHAACPNCSTGGSGRTTWWAKRLAEQRSALPDLVRCNCGRDEWWDEDGCRVGLSAGVPIGERATDAPHASRWVCAGCGHVVTRPSARASRFDALVRPAD